MCAWSITLEEDYVSITGNVPASEVLYILERYCDSRWEINPNKADELGSHVVFSKKKGNLHGNNR